MDKKVYFRYCELKKRFCLQCSVSGYTSQSLKHHSCTIYPNYLNDPEYLFAALELLKQNEITENQYTEWHKQWLSTK